MKMKSLRAATFLLLETLACHFGIPTGLAANPPRRVNGILGKPALLPVDLPRGKKAHRVEWIYQTEGVWIATFDGGAFNRSPYRDRFGQRLERAGDTALRIRELETEDSGVYVARVSLGSTGGRDQTFNLKVYEPVPEPQITSQLPSISPKSCNLTLHCRAFGKGAFNISWETGDPPRTLEAGADWYQFSANGSSLHVSWRPSLVDAGVTCLVSNPADRKTATFDVRGACASKGGDQSRRRWPALASLGVPAAILAATGGVWLWKRRRNRQLRKAGNMEGCP